MRRTTTLCTGIALATMIATFAAKESDAAIDLRPVIADLKAGDWAGGETKLSAIPASDCRAKCLYLLGVARSHTNQFDAAASNLHDALRASPPLDASLQPPARELLTWLVERRNIHSSWSGTYTMSTANSPKDLEKKKAQAQEKAKQAAQQKDIDRYKDVLPNLEGDLIMTAAVANTHSGSESMAQCVSDDSLPGCGGPPPRPDSLLPDN